MINNRHLRFMKEKNSKLPPPPNPHLKKYLASEYVTENLINKYTGA